MTYLIRISLTLFLFGTIFVNAQDMAIYRLNSYGYGDGRLIRFIPLSESLQMSGNLDSTIIAKRYLGDNPIVVDNFHVLNRERRKITLDKLNLLEEDNIYIYDLVRDTVFVVPVSETDIVAFLNPYGTYKPIPASDYMVGLHITEALLPTSVSGKYISDSFVFVGASNPFIPGNLERITWREIDSAACPEAEVQKNMRDLMKYYSSYKCYTYKSNDYTYFLKDYGGARHLVVRNEKTKKIELNQFYRGSEGSYLKPLNGVEENNGYDGYQYTGPIIRFKPRMVYGFIGLSFGCPSIFFVSPTEKPIYIRCDNRH